MNETFNLIIKGDQVSAVFAAAAQGLALRAIVDCPRSGWTYASVVCTRSALVKWLSADQPTAEGYPPGALLYFALIADITSQPLAQSALEMGREARAGRFSPICPFPASSLLAQAWLSGYEEETLRHG